MADQEYLDILAQGVEVWNQWRKDHPEIEPDLSLAVLSRAGFCYHDFSRAFFIGADLRETDFREANLSEANLSEANLSEADLRRANLSEADLSKADLSRAWLNGANFSGADLSGADLSNAQLQETNLTEATLVETIFANNDLSTARGIELVKHHGPSTIATNTLVNSIGSIPEAFLRGCGLSDWEIESAKLYNPDLSNEEINNIQYRIHDLRVCRAFQINPLFISYSHSNTDFIDAIEKHLVKQGIRFWRDIHHAKAGRLEKQIDAAIHLNDVVLLVLSKDSTSSDWVEHEARKAREKERQTGKDALCPVALDDSWKTCRWPERLREQIMEYNILDFSNWHDDAHFHKMFNRLLEGLNLFYK